jgi:hypothetical protein
MLTLAINGTAEGFVDKMTHPMEMNSCRPELCRAVFRMATMTTETPDGSGAKGFSLPLAGLMITQICIDYAISFIFENGAEIRIGAVCVFRDESGAEVTIDPESEQTRWGPLLRVANTDLDRAEVLADNSLVLSFVGGLALSVDPSPQYEAWTCNLPTGVLYISTPGGEIGIFDFARGD